MIRAALLLLAVCLMLGQEGTREIPPFPDDGNPRHKGQPTWCQAKDENGFRANCGKCVRACNEDNDNRCTTYCRSRKACRCDPKCAITGHGTAMPLKRKDGE